MAEKESLLDPDFDLPTLDADEIDLAKATADEEFEEAAQARAYVEAALARRDARLAEPYPPQTMTPATDAPATHVPAQDDDPFAVPDLRAPSSTSSESEFEPKIEPNRNPYEGVIPSRVITSELQKAMLRARLVIENSLGSTKLPNNESILQVLMREKPEVYVDAVIRVTAMHFIAWQKGMGLQ